MADWKMEAEIEYCVDVLFGASEVSDKTFPKEFEPM